MNTRQTRDPHDTLAAGEERAQALLRGSTQLFSARQVQAALDRMAGEIARDLGGRDPVLLTVMTGGMWTAVELSRRLSFAHQWDYLHATRYRGRTQGADLQWRVRPRLSLRGRCVLVVDDILDEGETLQAVQHCLADAQAEAVYTAVLVDKQHGRRPPEVRCDYRGVTVGDVFVFGCGMDIEEYWRGLPAIHAWEGPPG